jgi:hypothetical protein
MRRLTFAILLGVTCVSPCWGQSVQAGIQAWQKGEPSTAVQIWRPLAEAGDADAQFNLGQAYRLGRGVPVNLAAAQTWLGRAAGKGHVDAQTTLGLLLFDSGSRSEGLRWLSAAAEQGDPRALLIYGTALFNGDSVKPDPVLAYAYISRAAAQGLEPAKTTLAEMDRVMPLSQRKLGVKRALALAASGSKVKRATTSPVAARKGQPVGSSPATGAWRVQLGAFAQRGTAETLFQKMSGNAALAGRRPFYVAAGAITRLQVGPFPSRAAAAQACSALRGQPCFPVPAR